MIAYDYLEEQTFPHHMPNFQEYNFPTQYLSSSTYRAIDCGTESFVTMLGTD